MEKDAKLSLKELMADGGITSNKFVIQFLADLLNKPVATIGMPDVSALGAAYLAGLGAGVYESIEVLKKLNSDKKNYLPRRDLSKINEEYAGWQKTISS
jgi:glycerol kinase